MDLSPDSTAREMVAAVAAGDISARELLELQLRRIDETNPVVNAVVSLDADRAMESAATADERQARGEPLGPLHGLPFAFKDTHEAAGWRTTFGSPLMSDHVSTRDDLIVERIRAAGVVPIGKTNVPEWAAGSHTFNPIFGTTRNPYDPSRSAGGSSGGAAAALAAGIVPLADGSDMGGSLRNPASFCNVVGLRPSLGRVPAWPSTNLWETTAVPGPMARTVEDVSLLLSVVAGPDRRVPTASETPGDAFAPPLSGSLGGVRVAHTVDLGGAFEVDTQVREVIDGQAAVLADAGAIVTGAHPDLVRAEETFRTLRAWLFQDTFGDLLERHPDGFKPTLADNIRAGADLTGRDVARAYADRTRLTERMGRFLESYDVLVMPVSQVPPFSVDLEYPTEINGRRQHSYLDWMRSAYFITVTGCPAVSVPAGFTREGWPVGLQLVGPIGGERRLLEIAAAYERISGAGRVRPAL